MHMCVLTFKHWLTCIFDAECIMLNIFIFDIIWHENPKGLSVILYQKWIYLAWCTKRQKYKVNQCYCCSNNSLALLTKKAMSESNQTCSMPGNEIHSIAHDRQVKT